MSTWNRLLAVLDDTIGFSNKISSTFKKGAGRDTTCARTST